MTTNRDFRWRLALVLLAGMTFAGPFASATRAAGEIDFEATRVLATGSRFSFLVAADFNHDGHQDLATANDLKSTISVYLGGGDGWFVSPQTFPGGNRPLSIVSADFNNDGNPDLATTEQFGHSVFVTLGNGLGGFASSGSFPISDFAEFLVAGDFNEDGSPDIVVSSRDLGRTLLLLGNGAGGLSLPPIPLTTGFAPSCLTAVDLNADSHLDLVVGRRGLSSLLILLGNGSGGFTPATTPTIGGNPVRVVPVDLDGNGTVDLAVASNQVYVLLGFGNGGFAAASAYPAGGNGYSIATADFNQDGSPDVAVALREESSVSILTGNGAGSLSAPTVLWAGIWSTDLALADYNEDGRADAATANLLGEQVAVLLGDGMGRLTTAPRWVQPDYLRAPVSADFDEDGDADLAVASGMIRFFPGDGMGGLGPTQTFEPGHDPTTMDVADFNNDGHLDLVIAAKGFLGIPEEPPDPTLSMMLGNGAGGFAIHQVVSLPFIPSVLAAGDFNGDGNPDVVVAYDNGSFSLRLGNGTGDLGTAIDFSGTISQSLHVKDLNADGHPDLLGIGASVVVFFGDGAGGFSPAWSFVVGNNPRDVIAADFDEDGHVDLLSANCSGTYPLPGTLTFLPGDGAGGFGPAGPEPAAEVCPEFLRAADFDADGHLDVAVGNSYNRRLSVLNGRGNGTFDSLRTFEIGSDRGLVVADLDGNSLPDIAGVSIDDSISLALNKTQKINLTMTGAGQLSWNAVGTASHYDLVRGDLQLLHSTDGDFTAAVQECVAANLAATSFDFPVILSPGEGIWFLVRARMPVGTSTYESGSASQVGLRDSEIAASSSSCP